MVNLNPSNTGSGGGGSSTPAHLGAIIGGTVGGFLGIAAVILIGWFIIKRRNRWDDIFDHDGPQPSRRFSLSAEMVEPKPYHYGLVGHHASPPPGSPPLTTGALSGDAGYPAYGQRNAESLSVSGHGRNDSGLTPLNVSVPYGPVNGLGSSGLTPSSMSMSASRPSTASSVNALNMPQRPSSAGGMLGGGYQTPAPPPHSRTTSANTTLSNAGSIGSPPLNPQNSWALAGAIPPSERGHTPGGVPVAAVGSGSEGGRRSSAYSGISESQDYFGVPERSGSPVSFHGPQGLRIVNQRQSTMSAQPMSAASTYETMSSIQERALASPGLQRNVSDSGATVSSQRSIRERPKVDGKGRLIKKEGGRPEDDSEGPVPGPAPPAYTE